jgi:sterol desaturase/sphingolipid hydroxylase (fatty acid hydroxylase superfamily)
MSRSVTAAAEPAHGERLELVRPANRLVTYCTYPAIAVFTAVVVAFAIQNNFSRSAVAAFLAIVPVVVAVLVEWRYPLGPEWRMTKASFLSRDLPFIVLAVVTERLAETLAVLAAAAFVATKGFGPLSRMPLGIQVVITLVAFDLLWYWYHRSAHSFGRLWRVHGVHHAPAQLYALMHLVFHPFDLLASRFVIAAIVFRFSGVKPDAIFIAVVIIATQQMISHVNADIRVGPLNYVLIGTETHRYHHAANERGNYSSVIPLWDIIFRTFIYEPTRVPARLGLDDPSSYPNPQNFHETLAWPFRFATRPPAMATEVAA